ncbi:hypothetical protein TraAM80_02366 [Trypanosoma rangeli]|uniref:Uncharacterized protein n=1 Tax=Trypanosoma rangeli TaxID=5698 RepID=A0A3R7M4N9_TRYRA|nr:uncharacterized protein TraAM80_02366 [Trypanosoma rangeli]RNF08959.1 hypothetical protein TraAM80_02366 [Trypanosoma rangeli]|eukprot:RNF08959.1 hypothetical protein TraAM80_02366 [Trypanosoma rangeli]
MGSQDLLISSQASASTSYPSLPLPGMFPVDSMHHIDVPRSPLGAVGRLLGGLHTASAFNTASKADWFYVEVNSRPMYTRTGSPAVKKHQNNSMSTSLRCVVCITRPTSKENP